MYRRAMGAALFVVCVLLGVVALFYFSIRSGGKLIAARDAKLVAIATSHGLTVKPSSGALQFAAEGTAVGTPLRLAVESVSTRRHGSREMLRVVARAMAPRPAISVHRRADTERTESGPTFHEVSTGDDDFDRLFITSVEDDAAALDFLSTVRAELLPFEGASLSGVESFKVGSEVALIVDCTHPRFFEQDWLEKAVGLVLRLASNTSSYRAA